jgi:hypothetical protein
MSRSCYDHNQYTGEHKQHYLPRISNRVLHRSQTKKSVLYLKQRCISYHKYKLKVVKQIENFDTLNYKKSNNKNQVK